jgi:hypothetical protein
VTAGQTGCFYESVFAEMAADGCMAPAAVIFPAERWYEIDTAADRDAAELVFPRHLHIAGGSWQSPLSAEVSARPEAAV